MNFKSSIKSIAAAALLAVSASSQAAFQDLGNITGQSLNLASTVGVGSFLDTYSFSIDSLSDLEAYVISFSSNRFGIDNLTCSLSGASVSFTSCDLNVLGLSSGEYDLTVSGIGKTAFSNYVGAIAVTAVPEPETFAMLLAGLGVMGAIARRRKQTAAAFA